MSYIVINAFKCKESKLFFFETKRLDVPSTTPKNERFQWYFHDELANATSKLVFCSMDGNRRKFEDDVELDLNDNSNIAKCFGAKYQLEKCGDEERDAMLNFI
jgi:hypothetical protein